MSLYLIIFGISTFLFWIGSKQKSKWNLFALLAIILPCYLAAHRGIGIGTDTETYYNLYEQCSGPYEWEYLSLRFNVEPSYFLISKLSSYITGFSSLSFIYQVITIGFIYLSAWEFRKYINLWLVILMYFCFMYSASLNIVRQCAAVSILLYGSKFLVKSKIKLFWLFVLTGTFVHTSCAIASCFIYAIYYISFRLVRFKQIGIGLYLIGLGILLIGFLKLASLLGFLGFGRMAIYADVYAVSRSSYVSVTEITYRFFFAVMIWIGCNYGIISNRIKLPYYLLFITEVSLMMLGMYNGYLVRLAAYMTVYQLFLIPMLCKSPKYAKSSAPIASAIIVITALAYWWWTIVHNGTHEVIPYYFN